MLHYSAVRVADLERSGRFYDSILAPLGWRRQEDGDQTISWGMNKSEFFITLADSQRPGYGLVSFPANSIPAVKASYESGMANGGNSAAEPGSPPAFGNGTYAARLFDPDGYEVELLVAHS
ncbi:MAG TPA: VOC family protein [Solirubrobacterales bacterium]|nr:VOC family protein [Solirubrobacterales bacterium]